MPSASARRSCYYPEYLRLDLLLAAQQPESGRLGEPAHDEMLFIVVHQAYELWFKQILHELDRIQADFAARPLDDRHLLRIVSGLGRIHEIWKLLIQQVDVLETMTPLDFLDFRDLLVPASGFQSLQFREIESRFGMPASERPTVNGKAVGLRLTAADQQRLDEIAGEVTLAAQLDDWLSRTPFLAAEGFTFRAAYRQAVERSLGEDRAQVLANADLTPEQRDKELRGLDNALQRFHALFQVEPAAGLWRMSSGAVEGALFIVVHRDEPALQLPYRLLESLIAIDEALTLWRYRHALMVRRMLGVKTGTGGSSGHDYLRDGAERMKLFPDLIQLSSYLIPRSRLPRLPPEVERRLGFAYAQGHRHGDT
jgi:tryptophan 2,3-dioxygenase